MLYLSAEWFAAANQLLAEHTPVASELCLAVSVTGGPAGNCDYRMVLGPDVVGYQTDDSTAAVTMHLTWEQAVAIAQGNVNAQQAFLTGELRLDGDVTHILGHAKELNTFQDALAPLRENTRWR